MASTPEYYNQIIEHTVTASGASELEPFIPGDNGESQPCPAERKGPYKINTLKELVLHELHKKLKLTIKLDHQVTTHNYGNQKWALQALPIPSVLKRELTELYDRCPRHRGAYYVKVHRKPRTQVFIKRGSTLYNLLLQEGDFSEPQLKKYFHQSTLYKTLREKWSVSQLHAMTSDLQSSIFRRNNYQ